MDIGWWLAAAVTGYLAGSVSFARLIARLVAPGADISRLSVGVPGSEDRFESDTISATTVRLHLGGRYGCLTALLDMAKAFLPALLFRLWFPASPIYLLAAGMATVGHNWPVWHRFQGGRGLSPVLGGMLVLDWSGVLVTNLVAFLLGAPIKNMLVITGGGIVLMIPWVLWRGLGRGALLYVMAMNVLFWFAMGPELRTYWRLFRTGSLAAFRDAAELRVMGADGVERVDRLTLSALQQRLRRWLGRRQR